MELVLALEVVLKPTLTQSLVTGTGSGIYSFSSSYSSQQKALQEYTSLSEAAAVMGFKLDIRGQYSYTS